MALPLNPEAKANRAAMPHFARQVDQLRALFGARCKVTYAAESGLELGAPLEVPAERRMNATEWLAWVKTGEVPAGKQSPYEGAAP